MDVRFLVNLRTATTTTEFRRRVRSGGYLAPPHQLTAANKEFATRLRAPRQALLVDNGLYDDVGRIASALSAEAAPVAAELRRLTQQLDRPVRRADVPLSLRAMSTALARRAASATEAVDQSDGQRALVEQLSATGMVGSEDITVAVWLRLGLDLPWLNIERSEIRKRNRIVATRSMNLSGDGAVTVLPVASALDYDTAFDAGREFADAGVSAAAMGFGAYMADDSSTDTIKYRGRIHNVARNSPQRYLRTATVAAGFFDGWHTQRQDPPSWFHFLGLGAPVMLGLAAVAAYGTSTVTFDATSPIRDAAEGTLYTAQPSYLKVRTWRVAQRLASNKRERWRCPCPFCSAFVAVYPFDYDAGRQWWDDTNATTVLPADLRNIDTLRNAYPLLAEHPPGELRRQSSQTRVGHNHWILARVARDLGANSATLHQLEGHVGGVVERYTQSTSSDRFANAIKLGFDITRRHWPE